MKKRRNEESVESLLKKLIIVQLRIGGVSQNDIAKIMGKSLRDVSAVIKHIKVKD
jgi:hypothetical protein